MTNQQQPTPDRPKSVSTSLMIVVVVCIATVVLAIIGLMGVLSFHENDSLRFWQFIQNMTPVIVSLGGVVLVWLNTKLGNRTNQHVQELAGKVDQVQQQTNGRMGELIAKIPDATTDAPAPEAGSIDDPNTSEILGSLSDGPPPGAVLDMLNERHQSGER